MLSVSRPTGETQHRFRANDYTPSLFAVPQPHPSLAHGFLRSVPVHDQAGKYGTQNGTAGIVRILHEPLVEVVAVLKPREFILLPSRGQLALQGQAASDDFTQALGHPDDCRLP